MKMEASRCTEKLRDEKWKLRDGTEKLREEKWKLRDGTEKLRDEKWKLRDARGSFATKTGSFVMHGEARRLPREAGAARGSSTMHREARRREEKLGSGGRGFALRG
jgi:hypothetical protein